MKALFNKKIIIRLMIAELIITIVAFALTPYLFGTIRAFNPNTNIKTTSDSQLVKNPVKVVLAIKKASKKSVLKQAATTSLNVNKKKKKKSGKKVKKQNIVIISGLITKIEMSIYMQGSHKVTQGDNTVTLAYSNTINLDSYEGKNVKVSGTIKKTVEGNGKAIEGSEPTKTYIINITLIEVL